MLKFAYHEQKPGCAAAPDPHQWAVSANVPKVKREIFYKETRLQHDAAQEGQTPKP